MRNRLLEVTYPAIDGVVSSSSSTYDAVGNLLTSTDELGRITSYKYDKINRQVEIKTPLGFITKFHYSNDTTNNLLVLTVTDGEGRQTIWRTDGRGRLIEFVNADDTTTTYSYDGNNNLLTVVDELGRQTTYSYDELNREITVTTPLGNTTTTEYDSNSNVVKITDHLNNATRYTYNELDLLTTETDARGFVTTYTYDEEENLGTVEDPLDNVTTYTYDKLNRLYQETAVGIGTRTYSYDEVSNLIQLLDRNGRIVQFAYDDWNRQTAELWLDGDRIVNTIAYDYDAASQLVEVGDSTAKYSYEYDNDGRLTKEIRDTFGFTDKVVLDYTHDGVGNVLTVTDTVGGIQLSTETYTYDAQDRVISISQTGNGVTPKTAVVTYDDAGQLEQLEVLNAFSTAITFDLDGRPVTRTHTTAVGEEVAYGYEFDEVNRITTITGPNGESSFSYDSTDQLTSASSDFQEDESYDYDETGNRLGNDIGSHNRLLNDGVYSYEYDAEGNRIQRVELATGVVTDYEWDWRNRLVEVSSSNELGEVLSSSQYQYDAFDRRLTKLVDSNGDGIYELVEGFVYNDDSILLVLDGDEISQRYFYGPGTDWVLAEETVGSRVEYALTNHLNSVEFVLNSAGEVINEIIYDSFGNITSETNPGVDVRYGFTGRDFDKETGLGYNRTRYYDFVTRRFLSQDLLGFAAGDVNLYRYVGNTPTVYVDPSGMIVETIWDVASVVLGVASFVHNVYQGVRNRERSYFVNAGLDLVGIAADIGAVFLPGVPAVGAATIRAGRFALRAETAIEIAQVANVGVNAYQGVVSTQESVRAFRDGDYAGGIGHGIGATLSFGGATTSILGSAPGSAGNLARKGGNVINDIFGGGSWPRGGRRLVTAAESLGTAGRIDADEGDNLFKQFFAAIKDESSGPGNRAKGNITPNRLGSTIDGVDDVIDAGDEMKIENVPVGEAATLLTGGVGAVSGAILGGGLTWIAGGDSTAIFNAALQGSIQGGVAGLTLGLGGATIAGVFNGGVLGGILTGAVVNTTGNLASQGFGLLAGIQSEFDVGSLGFSAFTGAILGGYSLRPYTASNQTVTSWAPKGVTPNLQSGRWVMTGNATPRNWIQTGTGYPYGNSVTQTIPGSQLRYPSGWESIKGHLGQRVIR